MTFIPISIGFPRTSFIFCFSFLNVIALSDIFLLIPTTAILISLLFLADSLAAFTALSYLGLTAVQKGFTKKKPSFLSVPTYLPKKVNTNASLGFITLNPQSIIIAAINAILPNIIKAVPANALLTVQRKIPPIRPPIKAR